MQAEDASQSKGNRSKIKKVEAGSSFGVSGTAG